MNISRGNYEIFFIDYLDGVLSSAQVEELYAFLEQNPDLKKEFEQLEPLFLSPDKSVVFPSKSHLKKQLLDTTKEITPSNYQGYLVAKIEGDLSVDELDKLNEFIVQNPGAKRELELYEKTILVPDENIVFKNKKSLKRFYINPVLRKAVLYTSSLAASILLIFAVFFGFKSNLFEKSPPHYSLRIEKNQQPLANISLDKEEFTYSDYLKNIAHAVPAAKPKQEKEIVELPYLVEPVVSRGKSIQQIPLKKEHPALMTIDFEEQYYYTLAYYSMHALEEILDSQQGSSDLARESRQQLFSRIRKSLNPDLTQEERRAIRPDLWDIADVGIAHINKLAGNIISLSHYESGNESSISLAFGDKIEYSRKQTR